MGINLGMLVEAVIDTRIEAVVDFHDVFRGFWLGRGTGTAILDVKFAHELVSVERAPLFIVFLGLRKAYDTLDRRCLLHNLLGYGVGLLETGFITGILG